MNESVLNRLGNYFNDTKRSMWSLEDLTPLVAKPWVPLRNSRQDSFLASSLLIYLSRTSIQLFSSEIYNGCY